MSLPIATIDKLAFGGNGVCRIDGKICFVPYSCPGDEVSLRVTTQKKSYCTAAVSGIINPSSLRTEPVCPVFGECGGCNWQHIGYQTQLEQKRNILAEALWRGARVSGELVDSIVAAPLQYGYRSRLQFKVSHRNGKLCIGFYRHASHVVVDAAGGCPVALPVINEVLGRFRSILRDYPDVGSVTQISIDVGENGVVVIIQQSDRLSLQNRKYFLDKAGMFGSCTGLFVTSERQKPEHLWGVTEISYLMKPHDSDDLPVHLTYQPGGFSQVNQQQNLAMLSVVRKLGDFKSTERLLDLYCGNGNFSLPLAANVASVIAVESNREAIAAAENNKRLNKVANIHFFCDDVASSLPRLLGQNHVFDTVLLDPPRVGAGDAVVGITALQPNKIIYVSCDPSTLARDCGLLSGYGYNVVKSVPLDMFPQTFHIESITLLHR